MGGSTAFEDQAIDYDMTAKVPSEVFGAAANQFVAGLLGQANQAVGGNLQVPEVIDHGEDDGHHRQAGGETRVRRWHQQREGGRRNR